ncbi:MAG: hypothetical protein GY757_41530 [bacterium]|nr:hypothetical protein [bacterium]
MTRKVYLWFSESEAVLGRLFYVPVKTDDRIIECTAITGKRTPPSNGSKFLTEVYLQVV